MFYVEGCGLIAVCSLILIWPGIPIASSGMWGLMLGICLINLAGTILFYRALTIGTLSIVAPILASYAVVTALLAVLAGERPATLPLIGALLLTIGVITVSKSERAVGSILLLGVPEALGVAILLGVFFWTLSFATPHLGVLWPVVVMRLVRFLSIFLWSFLRKDQTMRLTRSLWLMVASAAVLDTLGFVSFNLGISHAHISIVTVLASLMTAVTVILAWVVLRERLSRWQWAGVGVIVIGVLLVNF
jgi:drug/metabolite transporter (DMT)-like permease